VFDLVHQVGETVQFLSSARDLGWLRLPPGECDVTLALPQVGLRPGSYRLKLSVSVGALHDILDVVDDLRVVVRAGADGDHGVYFQPRQWRSVGALACASPEPADAGDAALDDA
jgi:hypothetical protein